MRDTRRFAALAAVMLSFLAAPLAGADDAAAARALTRRLYQQTFRLPPHRHTL